MKVFFSILFFCSTSLASSVQNLNPQSVIDRLLSTGAEAQRIKFKAQRLRLPYAESLAAFDSVMEIKTNLDIDQSESLMGTSNIEDRSLSSSVKVGKKLRTGTELTAEYGRLKQNSILSTFSSSLRPGQQNQSAVYVKLKQSLLNNSFGKKDRNQVKLAKLQLDGAQLVRNEELEDLILQTLTLYWDTYIAKQSLKEAIEARQLILELVNTVKKKSRLGYAAPGELARVQAEYELQEQRVKQISANYLSLISVLKVKLSIDSEIELENVKNLPEVPSHQLPDLESQRFIKIANKQVESAKIKLSNANSSSLPVLNLDLSWSSIGIEQSADKAFTEMTSVTKPNYYVGLTLQFYLDSSTNSENVSDKKIELLDSQLSYSFLKAQLSSEINSKYNHLISSYKIYESAKTMLALRETALKQMKKAYNQGRLDIDILIQAYRDQFAAQVASIQAVAQYYVNLHDYAAAKDTLISNKHLESKEGSSL